jgi:hypothetical protein
MSVANLSESERELVNDLFCPNHHKQFDDYVYYIDPESFEIKGLENFEGKKITILFLKKFMQNFNLLKIIEILVVPPHGFEPRTY